MSHEQENECHICNYLKRVKNLDIMIFRNVGPKLYSQLIDHYPGLYDPSYADYRKDDLVYLHNPFKIFSQTKHTKEHSLPEAKSVFDMDCIDEEILKTVPKIVEYFSLKSPLPPNDISTLIIDNEFKPCELKYILLRSSCDDDRVKHLLHEQDKFHYQIDSYYDIVSKFTIYFLLIIGIYFISKKLKLIFQN